MRSVQGSRDRQLVDRAVKELGPLTALINSASLFENDDWQSASRKTWDDHIETNLRAPLVLSQLFAKQLPDGAKATSSTSSTSGC
jgi:NAD(P)-dependent dehydrogenase (short-subunit alcohol dehydrogenase family)